MLFLVGGVVLMAISTFAIAAAPSIEVLTVFYALVGLGHLVMVVATQSLVARGSAQSGYDRAFGHLAFAAAVGQLLGLAIAGVIAGQGSPDETIRRSSRRASSACLAWRSSASFARRGSNDPPVARKRTRPGPRCCRSFDTGRRAGHSGQPDRPVRGRHRRRLPAALGEERGWAASLVGGLLARTSRRRLDGLAPVPRLLADRFGRRTLLIVSMAVSAAARGRCCSHHRSRRPPRSWWRAGLGSASGSR
jgi:MFS family permease